MVLIADSGSTKTDWRLLNDGVEILQIQTKGLNPYYQNIEEIDHELRTELIPKLEESDVSAIYFYGAGCSTLERKNKISSVLSKHFKLAQISVQSDLIGAAHALSGNRPGIICIIGTGSGSCFYDGEKITENIPSLGFILGDEGSGSWLGKKMVTDFLRGQMPQKTMKSIQHKLNIDKETILENVNHQPMPSKYLGSFAQFISKNMDQTYFYQLLFDGFTEFAKNYILRYPNFLETNCHFVGSIAFHNQKILRHVARYNGFTIGNIIKSPVNGLTKYYADRP